MAFLTPDRIRQETIGDETLAINVKIIPDSARATKYVASHCQKGRPMKPCAKLNDGTGQPKGITIHNTAMIKPAAGTNAAEQYTRSTWPNCNMGGVVVHFYVWHEVIWQLLDESECGWHAADGSSRRSSHRKGEMIGGNLDTIAIEVIGTDKESEATAAKLTAYLLKAHNLVPDTDVYTHNYFYPVKYCPAYILPHWPDFMAAIVESFNKASGAQVLHRVQCDAFKVWDYAIAQYYKLKEAGYTPYMVTADGFYKVQVGAYAKLAGAEVQAAELKARGYKPFITTKAGVPVSIPA